MKYVLLIMLSCFTIVASAQPVAVLKTGSSEITSGTVSRDDLLSVENILVTDAEKPGTSYKIVSVTIYYQPEGGNLNMAVLNNENISTIFTRIDESEEGQIGKGDRFVITDIKVQEGENGESQLISNGIILQVD